MSDDGATSAIGLRAGQLELVLDGIDLRTIRFGDIEVAQQVYIAVRDADWNTIPAVVTDLEISDASGDAFEVRFRSRHELGTHAFAWTGVISGRADGVIDYSMTGSSESGFPYNRMGLNVLHDAEGYGGRRYRASIGDRSIEGDLPDLVGPQAIVDGRETGLFAPFDRLELWPEPEVSVTFAFAGDEFEMEDQRNYGDGTFKVYSTPLQRPGPFRLEPGQTFSQSVRIAVSRSPRPSRSSRPSVRSSAAESGIVVGEVAERTLPGIGLGYAADSGPLSSGELVAVGALRPDHIRVELATGSPPGIWQARLDGAQADARQLGCEWWVELRLEDGSTDGLEPIVAALRDAELPPRCVFVNVPSLEPIDGGLPDAARALVRQVAPGLEGRIGVATDFLAELLRAPFDASRVDLASFALSPTVHRSDDQTVMENLGGLESEVESARQALGQRPLSVGPISLATRHGPYPDGTMPARGWPPTVDARQSSVFAAAWTVGCLAALCRTDVDAVTIFETVGWRGTVEHARAPLGLEPGWVFPVWHVLADLAAWRDRPLVQLDVGHPGLVALAVGGDEPTSMLLASTRPGPVATTIEGLGLGVEGAAVRVLSAATAALAMRDPQRFRAEPGELAVNAGVLRLDLDGYAVVRIDALPA